MNTAAQVDQLGGVAVVISAPSGAGKSTIVHRLTAEYPDFVLSVSATTRPPRAGEVEGVDYYFVSQERFEEMVQAGLFLEWAHVHTHRYGTPREPVERDVAAGKVVLLDIDVQGAMQVDKRMSDAALIFVVPPTFPELARRLRARHTDSTQQIELRLQTAREEINFQPQFDYLVVNDSLDRAVDQVRSIIVAERLRTKCHSLPAGWAGGAGGG